MFKKSLVMFSLIFSSFIYSGEFSHKQSIWQRSLGSFGQSRIACLYNDYVSPVGRGYIQKALNFSDEPASQEYQDLGKEAQQVLVPEERHVPVKKIAENSIISDMISAVAEPDALYVNESRLNNRTFGSRRSTLFHEAVHKKYNDDAVGNMLEIGSFFGSMIVAHRLIKAIKPQGRFKLAHGLTIAVTGMGTTYGTASWFVHFRERRADIEGHYATQCAVCVQESADAHRTMEQEGKNPLLALGGYLKSDELERIACDLEQQNKVCAYHNKCQ